MNPGDTLVISFFDSAASPVTSISSILVTWAPGEEALSLQSESAFSLAEVASLDLGPNGQSCALGWSSVNGGSLPAETLGGDPNGTGTGDWELTIVFQANGNSFGVDPELELVGGGG